uniref:Dopamine receptor D4 n=1 Tax=Athene cunicularia TaxID=194338 RepID=A0A663M118_ATHCN
SVLLELFLPIFQQPGSQHGGVWSLSTVLCDALMTMDVMLCTASIFNLCAISVDRFIAVSIPLNYNRRQIDLRQLILISTTWIFAFAVASPVIFGLNNVPNRNPSLCQLEDDNYIVYSSICSFFIPCPVMLVLYCAMFHGLKRWEEARKAKLRGSIYGANRKLYRPSTFGSGPRSTVGSGRPCGCCLLSLVSSKQALLGQGGKHAVCDGDNRPGRTHLRPPPRAWASQTPAGPRRVPVCPEPPRTMLPPRGGRAKSHLVPPIPGPPPSRSDSPLLFSVPTGNLWALCKSCTIPTQVTSTVTWLGYVNSALNPIIYTVFNAEFRNFFRKVLHLFC